MQDVDQKLGELVGLLGGLLCSLCQGFVVRVSGDHRVLVADRAGAGAGRDDDRVVLAEGVDVAGDQLGLEVAAVGVHLATTGLLEGELDGLAEALEDLDRRLAGVGEERVDQARGE